jgi:hypothetical protein
MAKVTVIVKSTGKPNMSVLAKKLLELSYKYTDEKKEQVSA